MTEAFSNLNQPRVIELEATPLGHYMAQNETLVIDDFGVEPGQARTPLENEKGELIHESTRATVQVRVGSPESYEYVEVNDVSESPWKDVSTGQTGNFVVVRWAQTVGYPHRIASVHPLVPGKMLGIGRDQAIGTGGRDIVTVGVSRDHAAIGINDEGRLVIENHNPTFDTHVRNLVHSKTTKIPPVNPASKGPAGSKPGSGQLTSAIDIRTGERVVPASNAPLIMPLGHLPSRSRRERLGQMSPEVSEALRARRLGSGTNRFIS